MAKKENKIPEGYKNSVLGIIPEDWKVKRVSEVAKIMTGKKDTQNKIENGLYPFYVRSQTAERINSYSFDGEAVLTAGDGVGVGKVFHYVNEKFDFHQRVYKISDFTDYNGRFFFEYFQYYFQKEVVKFNAKASVDSVRLEMIAGMKIPYPDFSEQTAIANLLTTWDKSIQLTTQLIEQKEKRKKWLMQQLLTGKKRLKGFEGEEWKEVKLGTLFNERNDVNNLGLPLLSVGANGIYPQSDSIKKDTSNEDKSKYKKICIGDIGYNTMRMWQGRSALSNLEGIISPAYTVVTPTNNVDARFFSFLFKTPYMMNLFYRKSQGLVDDTLNCKYKDFSIVKIKIPVSKKEQEAIAKTLITADKEIFILRNSRDKFQEQKKGLMQILLTGKKRLKTK
jgi:type I restriction enzyme S subunit